MTILPIHIMNHTWIYQVHTPWCTHVYGTTQIFKIVHYSQFGASSGTGAPHLKQNMYVTCLVETTNAFIQQYAACIQWTALIWDWIETELIDREIPWIDVLFQRIS